MNREKRMLLSLALFILALLSGVLSAFQDWHAIQVDPTSEEPTFTQNYVDIVSSVAKGFLSQCLRNLTFPIGNSWLLYAFNVLFFLCNTILLLFLLVPIFLVRILCYSRAIWWLWNILHVSSYGFMIYIYQKHDPYILITGLCLGDLGNDPHSSWNISWLSGFYFGCAALFLHLCAMLLLFFPIRKKPMT